MSEHQITVRQHPDGRGEFLVDGVDIAAIVGAQYSIEQLVPKGSSTGTAISVQMFPDDFIYETTGSLRADLPESVVTALTAAGWTPPAAHDEQEKSA